MKSRLRKWWDGLSTSFFFLPGGLVLASIGLALGAAAADEHLEQQWASGSEWIWGGSPDGARVMLSAIASSMITVAGVVFSVTIVVLTLASNQFGPRTLRNFMSDKGNQAVLGTFLATFVYCLLVMRTVRGDGAGTFVPHLSITIGIALALASVGVLIYFVHHVSWSIQAGNVVAVTVDELRQCLDRVFPEREGSEGDGGAAREPPAGPSEASAKAASDGYVQAIESESLFKAAIEHDVLLQLVVGPGDFLFPGSDLARIRPGNRQCDQLDARIRKAFVLGRARNPVQDLEFCILRVAEVGVRALSPSTNDPYTALACIDHLGAAMNELVQRKRAPTQLSDSEGRLRVFGREPAFAVLARAAWREIRHYSGQNALVPIRLMDTFAQIVPRVRRSGDLEVLWDHLWRVEHDACRRLENPRDLESIREHHRNAVRVFEEARLRLGGDSSRGQEAPLSRRVA